jgi:hypothetical protein
MNKETRDRVAKLQSDLNVAHRNLGNLQEELFLIIEVEREAEASDQIFEILQSASKLVMNAGTDLEVSVSVLGGIVNHQEQPKVLKTSFNDQEKKELHGGFHGNIRFDLLNDQNERVLSCYRATIPGGLDFMNAKMEEHKSTWFTVHIMKKTGGKFRSVAHLETEAGTIFQH